MTRDQSPRSSEPSPFGAPTDADIELAVDELRQLGRELDALGHSARALALWRVADRLETEWLP